MIVVNADLAVVQEAAERRPAVQAVVQRSGLRSSESPDDRRLLGNGEEIRVERALAEAKVRPTAEPFDLLVRVREAQPHQHGRGVDAPVVPCFADRLETEHALVIAHMARIHFDHQIVDPHDPMRKDIGSMY